jgi:hypothetical protein
VRVIVAASLLALFLGFQVSAQSPRGPAASPRAADALDRPFPSGGRVEMDLSAGEYRLTGIPEDRIHVEWRIGDASRPSDVRTSLDVRGSTARLSTDGPQGNFRVSIQIPSRSDLHLRLTAGELNVEGIEGSKDIELHAGEINIDVGKAEDYARVDLSVWAGEIQAAPFNVVKGGLFRSFGWRGSGRYRLRASLKAGEVRLSSALRSAS